MKKSYLLLLALVASLFAFESCSESFKKEFSAAGELASYFNATGTTLGTETKVDNGKKRKLTTLSYSGVKPNYWDENGVQLVSNVVAWKFIDKVGKASVKDDTHIGVKVEMTNGKVFENEFPVDSYDECAALLAVSDKMVEALIARNYDANPALLDQEFLPDSIMPKIYSVNDKFYESYGPGPKTPLLKGMRFDQASDYPDLKMLNVIYFHERGSHTVRYTINVSRGNKKVVYVGVENEK